MFHYSQSNLHVSALLFSIGVFCSLCVTIPLIFLINQAGLNDVENVHWIYITVAVTTFLVFSNFKQIISARHVWWVLRNGFLRWTQVLLVFLLSLFFILAHKIEPAVIQKLIINESLISLPLLMVGLAISRLVIHKFNNLPSNRRKAVFLELGPQANLLYMRLQRSPILGIDVIGYYSAKPIDADSSIKKPPKYLGTPPDALPHLQASEFDIVFVQPAQYYDEAYSQRLLNVLSDSSVASIYIVPETLWSTEFSQSGAEIAGIPLLAIHDSPILGLARAIKRGLDLVLCSIALLFLWPVMLVIAIAVRLDSPGPILFKQARYGERGQKFYVYKFRSMYVDNDKGGPLRQAHKNDDRITPVGRFLRRKSLDELPQLFNVLNGTMSLVGPRPHAVAHNEEYRHLINGYMLRHSIKPGITGWAQINGLRGETDTLDKMQRRIEYDRYYIQNWSLRLDIQILFRTVWTVIRGNNAY